MLKYISREDLLAFNQRFRAHFMNSITGFKSANLIGTKSEDGFENLAIFNSFVHLGANPPYIGFILRPTTVERHTYDNILNTVYFTINHIRTSFIREAHHTAAKFPKEVSEFNAVGLSPEYKNDFFAPYVKESYIQMGLKHAKSYEIDLNGTILVAGEVLDIWIKEDLIEKDGNVRLDTAESVAISNLDSYYKTERLARFEYAKPENAPKELGV